MTVTIDTFTNTLQNYYVDGFNSQVVDHTFLFNQIRQKKVKWDGKQCVFHAHVGRNNGRGFSDGKIPTAGRQTTINLNVTAKRYYGAFKIDGMLMRAAPKGGGHAFLDWSSVELDRLVDDCIDDLNYKTISGGVVKGYLNEHKASSTVNADIVTATATSTASSADTWEYSGHFDEFNGSLPGRVACDNSTPATWVPVKLIREDTGNPVDLVTDGSNPTDLNIFVTGYNEELMTLQIRCTSDNAGTAGEVHGFTTATVAPGFAVSLQIDPVTEEDSAATALGRTYDSTAVGAVEYDANGIFSNLSMVDFYTVTRHSADATAVPAVAADGDAPILRMGVRTMATSGNHARTSITAGRMERMRGIVKVESRRKINSIWVHDFFKATYTALNIIVANTDASKATNLDIGFAEDGFMFGNIKMRSDSYVPRGLMIFWNKASWSYCQLDKGTFADLDGSIFSRVSGRDEWEGFWRIYYNVVCTRPKANMILTGFSLN